MKQSILKKLLASGTAAIGILGLSTPAAFAWSGNSSYSSYHPTSYSSSEHSSYSSYDQHYTPCYKLYSSGYNEYGGQAKGCHHLYAGQKKCDHYDNYQSSSNW